MPSITSGRPKYVGLKCTFKTEKQTRTMRDVSVLLESGVNKHKVGKIDRLSELRAGGA